MNSSSEAVCQSKPVVVRFERSMMTATSRVSTRRRKGGRDIIDITLTGRGRRAVGSWPGEGDAYDKIIAAIEARIDDEPDPEKKSRLRKGAEGIGGMGRDLFVEIAAAVTSKQAGA